MSERVAIRPDIRLDDGPMQAVSCTACSATVEVRKSSWEQTSIQWHAEAIAACHRRRETGGTADGVTFAGCSSLGESILAAAASGTLTVHSGEPLPVDTEQTRP